MRYRRRPAEVQAWSVAELIRLASTDFWKLPPEVIEAYEHPPKTGQGIVFGNDAIHLTTFIDGRVFSTSVLKQLLILTPEGSMGGADPAEFYKLWEPTLEEDRPEGWEGWS